MTYQKETKNQIKKEINAIVDSLAVEVNTKECATIFGMSQAIIKHNRFIDYITENPDIYVEITRNEDGEIIDLVSYINFKDIVEKRVRWNMRNLKNEDGFQAFHCFAVNSKTNKSRYIPPTN